MAQHRIDSTSFGFRSLMERNMKVYRNPLKSAVLGEFWDKLRRMLTIARFNGTRDVTEYVYLMRKSFHK